jgi:hypothetical protein
MLAARGPIADRRRKPLIYQPRAGGVTTWRRFAAGSKPTHEKQDDENDQDYAYDADATVPIAVTIAPKSSTEAAKQKDDEENDEYKSKRHELSPKSA